MKELVDSLLAFIPFLQRYPFWVKILFVSWLCVSCALLTSLIFAKKSAGQADKEKSGNNATISGSPNSTIYQAGRDIVIGTPGWKTEKAGEGAPLLFRAAAYKGAQYTPGTMVGSIAWQDRFNDIRLDIQNRSGLDVEDIDLMIQTDQSIAAVESL